MINSIAIQEIDIYHEAGHTAMFCYYGIPIQYVSIRPDLTNGYAGMVMIAVEPPPSGRAALENWMRCAAAGRAADSHRRGCRVPEAAALITEFRLAAADVAENPDPAGHHDLRNFAYLGLQRDQEINEPNASQMGPAAWAPIWLEAEELVRGDLWPAVRAVAEKLWAMAADNIGKNVATLPDLDGEEASAIVSKAMGRSGG